MKIQKISFIIPALNEEVHIGGVLDSIKENAQGDYRYEVILVDNGSTDRTIEIAKSRGATCLLVPKVTISSLRNIGVAKSKSDILIFLDADVYLAKGWGKRIKYIIERLNRETYLITGSLYGVSESNNWIERIWFAPRTSQGKTNYINGGHLIIHKKLFTKIGGFDSDLETGEDYEFCIRAKRMGALIENDIELKVIHAGYPKSIKSFFTRERWHARGDYSSAKTFLSSKPALISFGNFCMILICLIGMVGLPQFWLSFLSGYFFFIVGVSLMASLYKCRHTINSEIIGTLLLYIIYFSARTLSFVDLLISLNNRKITSMGKID